MSKVKQNLSKTIYFRKYFDSNVKNYNEIWIFIQFLNLDQYWHFGTFLKLYQIHCSCTPEPITVKRVQNCEVSLSCDVSVVAAAPLHLVLLFPNRWVWRQLRREMIGKYQNEAALDWIGLVTWVEWAVQWRLSLRMANFRLNKHGLQSRQPCKHCLNNGL